MSKIIVNTTLFVTCRLCLEDLGVYQIVPEVKEQILYCFGINIEPFDGLSQLICNKCEKTLGQFTEVKKNYIAKQIELSTRISGHNETVPSEIQVAKPAFVLEVKPKSEPKPIPESKQITVSPPANPSRPVTPKVNNHIEENIVRKRLSRSATHTPTGQKSDSGENTDQPSWKKAYKKKFYCRFCLSCYSNKKYFKVHLANHRALKSKHKDVFKKYCKVQLSRADGITNLTKSDKRVVHNKNKIVESRNNDLYIVYSKGDEYDNTNSYPTIESRRSSSDTNDVDLVITHKKPKRRRICSSSSNETVVLDDKNEETKHQPGISIVDSDDETEATSKNKEMLLSKIAKETHKDGTIGKIITMCCMKYEKQQSDCNGWIKSDNGTQIKRKILSLGRKIINTKGFNSNVLVKFLQHKNLDIVWVPKSAMYNANESNFVKIQTRKKNDSDKDKNDVNWVRHSATRENIEFSYEQCCVGCNTRAAVTATPILESNPNEQYNEINVTDMSDSAVLSALLTNDTKKLLNANPVANPKQLPKKCAIIEKINSKTPEPELCMPIITHTTSLAEVKKPIADAPRIKVKPVSELMSKESFNLLFEPNPRVNMSYSQPVIENPPQAVSDIYILPANIMSISNNIPTSNITTMSPFANTIVSATGHVTQAPKNAPDYVILDTVELPHTKTNSPLKYFKNLLQMHNIVLLDQDAELSPGFHCLIRFKVRYNQETTRGQALILSLSLHCNRNVFCLKVKGRSQDDIDMGKITANWQWEILKIYKGEVEKKMLDSATKIGQETLEYVNSFLCLLKSINYLQINNS